MHVNFLLAAIAVEPSFVQVVPALGAAAFAGVVQTPRISNGAIASERSLFISEVL